MHEAIFHAVGSLLSFAAVAWAVRELREFGVRWPLLALSVRRFAILVACGVVVLAAPIAVSVPVAMTLPTTPTNFAGMMIYALVVGIAALVAVFVRLQKLWASAWIEPHDDGSFSLRADGRTEVVTLAPGSVQALALETPHHLQVIIEHGERRLHVIVPVSVDDARLARPGVVVRPPLGPRLVAGSKRFMRLIEPYLAHEPRTRE